MLINTKPIKQKKDVKQSKPKVKTVIHRIKAEPKLQEKSTTTNGLIVADEGYDGLSKVNVNVSGGGGFSPYDPIEFFEYYKEGPFLNLRVYTLTTEPGIPPHAYFLTQYRVDTGFKRTECSDIEEVERWGFNVAVTNYKITENGNFVGDRYCLSDDGEWVLEESGMVLEPTGNSKIF